MKRLIVILSLILSSIAFSPAVSEGQCSMCRASAENIDNDRGGNKAARGLNDGIIFLFATPYVVVGVVGYLWYRNRQKTKRKDNPKGLS